MTAFHNKSVLVLGGSRGIGAAIVRRFVADGASVVFSYSGSPEAAERLAAETGSTAVQADTARRCSRTGTPSAQGQADRLCFSLLRTRISGAQQKTAGRETLPASGDRPQ